MFKVETEKKPNNNNKILHASSRETWRVKRQQPNSLFGSCEYQRRKSHITHASYWEHTEPRREWTTLNICFSHCCFDAGLPSDGLTGWDVSGRLWALFTLTSFFLVFPTALVFFWLLRESVFCYHDNWQPWFTLLHIKQFLIEILTFMFFFLCFDGFENEVS